MKISVLNGVDDIRQHFSDKIGKQLKMYRDSQHASKNSHFFFFLANTT